MSLEQVVDLLEEGRDGGLHLGAQLEIRRAGADPVSIAVGESRRGVAMRADALVSWFSCTKAVTAVAIAQLWERGRLHIDDAVSLHVPEFAANGKGSVTIRHLLTHTGGFRRAVLREELGRYEWDELTARICESPLEDGWVPGERAGYHTVTGFHMLGEIVSRLGGRDYAAYVSEEIFEPLDMADSWLRLTPERYEWYGDRMAVMYGTDPPTTDPEPVLSLDSARGFRRAQASGSGVGPMGDLVKLYEMFLGGGAREGERVLNATTVEAIRARHRSGMPDETFGMIIDWGLGLMLNSWHYRRRPASYGYGDHASMRTFGHGGQQSSIAFCDPEAGLAVALCCNGMAGEIANHRRTQAIVTAVYLALSLGA